MSSAEQNNKLIDDSKKQTNKKNFSTIQIDIDGYEKNLKNNVVTDLNAYANVLIDLCKNNIEYYRNDETTKGQRLYGAFFGLIDHVETVKPLVNHLNSFAHEYDFDDKTPGNGYRSFVYITDCAIKYAIKMCRYVMENRNSLLFRKGIYMKEIESCNHLMASMGSCLQHLSKIRDLCEPGNLFPPSERTAEHLFHSASNINQYCFYGRCIGFQFCESFRPVLKFILICMAGFSEAYYSNGGKIAKATSSMWTSGKYFMDPELRAKRIVNISENASVDFCKSFWFLAESELMHTLPSFIGTQLKINKLITINTDPLKLKNENTQEFVEIPTPSSHLGAAPIVVRLLSASRREGMAGESVNCSRKKTTHSKTNKLVFHIHGGGFVAQSSKSHETYLKEWAIKLNIPILSIDYSLAPEAPYPRALEECFYAYCWAIKNAHLLGSTGEKIVLAGDSAGANLCLCLTLLAIEKGIRKPDGIFTAYCPSLISFMPSPARLLGLMDPLLPFGFLYRCLTAYVNPNRCTADEQNEKIVAQLNYNKKKSINLTHSNSLNSKSSLTTVSEAKEEDEYDDFDDDMKTEIEREIINQYQTNGNAEIISDNSDSFEENSVWEHIQASDSDLQHLQAHKSPVSDATSDTLAGASFRSTTGGLMDILTPDETNGLSLEEDTHSITTLKTNHNGDLEDEVYGPLTAAEVMELDLNQELEEKERKTTQYVSEFIERYVLDTAVDSEGNPHPVLRTVSRTQSEENIVFDIGREAITVQNIQEKISKVAGNLASAVTSTISTMTTSNPISESTYSQLDDVNCYDTLMPRSPSSENIFHLPRDPHLSPYWASDELLKQMPPVKCITVLLDPCLDDCVMLAKKLKKLNVPTNLDILNGIPHGFLNFVVLSKEAHEASLLCVKRIGELFDMNIDVGE